MPDKPIPENDPIVSKSLAPHYFLCMVVLMATLFWALWDVDFGQRPWKRFQHEWKSRYSSFLKTARTQSAESQKEIENNPDYQNLQQDYEAASKSAEPRINELREKLREVGAKILAVQDGLGHFTDRRAYVTASTYDIETTTSPSAKQSKQRDLAAYKAKPSTVDMPDGKVQTGWWIAGWDCERHYPRCCTAKFREALERCLRNDTCPYSGLSVTVS